MKNKKKYFAVFSLRSISKAFFVFVAGTILLSLWQKQVCAQSVGINSTGALPANAAMLDIVATDKGLLIPRVSLTDVNVYAPLTGTPVTSLLVYTNTAPIGGNGLGYYYWDGAKWIQFLTGGAPNTAWLITGNLGTLSGTNFLGTLDNQDLDIRTNNIIKTRITTKGQIEVLNTGESVFVGDGAGENDDLSSNENVFVGYHAGFANVTGFRNTAVGNQALAKNTTGNNTAIGYQALYETTTGAENVACGMWALSSNITGAHNTATGFWALSGNTIGIMNTGAGFQALYSNSEGSWNNAIGFQSLYVNMASNNSAFGTYALRSNTYAEQNVGVGNYALYTQSYANGNAGWATNNVAVGYRALYLNQPTSTTNGLNNTAVGTRALQTNTTGINNTAIGYAAFNPGAIYDNSTALGANAAINASNKVRIGDVNVTAIEGQVAYTFPSDGRFKSNITEEVKGLDFINRLRPVVYNFDTRKFDAFLMQTASDSLREEIMSKKDYNESSSLRQSGFIAQEVEQAAKESGYNFNGVHKPTHENDNYSIAYSLLTVPLVKAVQEQQKIINDLRLTVSNLQTENNNLKSQISNIQAGYNTRLKKLEEIFDMKVEK